MDANQARALAQEFWRKKPGKKLEQSDQLVFHYALRWFCQRCGRLMDWDSPEGIAQLVGECCGMRYTLQPHTVTVGVEDVSDRPILPTMQGSNYSDPETDLKPMVQGENDGVVPQRSGGLTPAQKELRDIARAQPLQDPGQDVS